MQKTNNDVKQNNYKPDERMQFKLGARKFLHTPSQTPIHCNYTIANSSNGMIPVNGKAGREYISGISFGSPMEGKERRTAGFHQANAQRMPGSFCRKHLPAVDTLITLETKGGELYEAKYLPRLAGLSGGWRRFAIDQKLVEGDLAIFHLVEATRFKVYIIRQGSSTVKLPTPLLNLYRQARQCAVGDNQLIAYKRRKVHKSDENSNKKKGDKNWKDTYQVDIDFNTVINESLENQHLSERLTHDYYELCHAHNAVLHAHLCKGLNPELFVGDIKSIISETVSIGIALRTCTPSTFLDNFAEWTKILRYYGAIGMNVSLLSARLDHLRNLAVNSDGAVSRRRYIEACCERIRSECEVKKLEMVLAKWRKFYSKLASMVKVLESRAGWDKYMEAFFSLTRAKDEIREIEVLIAEFAKLFEHYDAVIETLKLKAINHEHQFQKEAAAPWS